MVYCIKDNINERLSILLEDLAMYFYEKAEIRNMFMSPYYVHKPCGLDLDGSIEKDGINIRIDLILNDEESVKTIYSYQELKSKLDNIREETNINIIPIFSHVSFWKSEKRIGEYTNREFLLSTGEILFDKDGFIKEKKRSLYYIENIDENYIEFSPKLRLKKIEE